MSKGQVLIVDDEEAIRDVVSTLLETQGYSCSSVANGREAVERLKKNSLDLVLSDMLMPEMDGLQLLSWLHSHDPEIPIIMVTSRGESCNVEQGFESGCNDYVTKPIDGAELVQIVNGYLMAQG